MQVLGSRRGGVITLALAAVAFVAAAAFAVVQLVQRPGVERPGPAPGSAVRNPRPTVSFSVGGGERLSGLRVLLDGRDVTARVRGDGDRLVLAPARRLAEGSHDVQVRFRSDNVFSRSVDRRWSFDVDTVAPALAVTEPAGGATGARRAVRFAGRTEPGATVAVAFAGGDAEATAGANGRWSTIARLPDGVVAATVTATDRAGNSTRRRRRVIVDTIPPQLALSAPATGERLTGTDTSLVYGSLTSDDPRALTFTASVNGRAVTTAKGTDAPAAAGAGSGYTQAAGGGTPPLQIDGRRFAIAVGTLPQGRNLITVTARDRVGNLARRTRVVVVDTTEVFGPYDVRPGARGADVVDLQRRLREARVYPKRARLTGVVDATTAKSILRYQKRYKLPKTGVADARTRSSMVGRLVVNIGQRKLRLIRHGKVWTTYSIAVGQPAHPTPTGEYEINDKQVDPAWHPPDSPWAAELSTIPPGPGNPLGTRWIGTTAPAIGIHGTYADYSIGTAASHGCMRMHIPDVEQLYDQVTLGMKISIRP